MVTLAWEMVPPKVVGVMGILTTAALTQDRRQLRQQMLGRCSIVERGNGGDDPGIVVGGVHDLIGLTHLHEPDRPFELFLLLFGDNLRVLALPKPRGMAFFRGVIDEGLFSFSSLIPRF